AQALGGLAWHERGRGEPRPAREALPARGAGNRSGTTPVPVDVRNGRGMAPRRGQGCPRGPAGVGARKGSKRTTGLAPFRPVRDVDPPHVGALLSANVAGTGPTTPPKQAAEPRPWAGGIAALEFP